MSVVEELLTAGAVLPPGTEGAGERAVPLTARSYRHPGLEDRVVVRLVAAELGAAEDLAAGFLGLEPDGEPEVVGLGLRAALGFPEWVLVHHPEDGHHALAVVPEIRRIAQRAKSKPKAALDGFHELAERLAAAVPHLLPTFYEQAGREFAAVENLAYAAQMFTHARRAEVEHGLPLDEERTDAVFLEFALAGALPVKTLSGYARELAGRVAPDEALRRFTRLCVRRTAGGLPPSSQMAGELRRLARAAGQDAQEVELAYLQDVLALAATVRAAPGWWKAHRAALAVLAERRPEVRGTLLNLMPAVRDGELPGLWLELLEGCGAAAALCDPSSVPEEARSEDGAAGWLKRFLAFRGSAWRAPRLPGLYALVERMAGRLKDEIAARGAGLAIPDDVDLLDLLLALDVPVADPEQDRALYLENWARGEGQRDLLALAADPRFRAAFHRGADRFGNDRDGLRALRLLAASPGGRPMLAGWVAEVARRSTAVGLPELPDALNRLGWLPGAALALAEDAVRAAVAADLAPVLQRTLRAGLFDELSWPAWEEAATGLVARDRVADLIIADAWPHLVVGGGTQARVIGPEGTVLAHDLRIPAGDLVGEPGFHHVDGELFVHWASAKPGERLRGYWHTDPGRVRSVEGSQTWGMRMYWYNGHQPGSLPLPGGGRTTGDGVLRPGDTTLPATRRVITDGTSYWVWHKQEEDSYAWHEYDPVSGRHGRVSMPAFLAEATRGLPEGSALQQGSLQVVASPEATPAGTPVDGLLGWRLVRLPDGSMRGESLAGDSVTLPSENTPAGMLFAPGDDRPRVLSHSGYQVKLIDPDGVVTAVAKTDGPPGRFAQGTAILPPAAYWHCLRPRDPRGSAALRRIDRETAAALLKVAATGEEDLTGGIRALLPDITHEGLLAGVAGVVQYAGEQQQRLDRTVERLEEALTEGTGPQGPAGPADRLLHEALDGLGYSGWWLRYGGEEDADLFGQLRSMERLMAEGSDKRARIHLDGLGLPGERVRLADLIRGSAGVAFRAVSPFTDPEHREALGELLRACGGLGLLPDGRPSRWRRCGLRLGKQALTDPDGHWRRGFWRGLLPLEDGAFLAVLSHEFEDESCKFTALFHDPSGRFEAPEPYTMLSSEPVASPRDGARLEDFPAQAAERGPAPWFPEAAEEFSRLTGVSQTMARLVVAGMPRLGTTGRAFLSAETRAALGVKAADSVVARDELRRLSQDVRQAVLGALLPADPSLLWTRGPDAAAAAEVWNAELGKRVAVPEMLLAEASKAVRTGWVATHALPALLDPAAAPELSRDLKWVVRGDRVAPEDEKATGFTAATLVGAVAMAAWLAHRLPAGDGTRAALPAALAAVRARLAAPDLMLSFDRYVNLPEFRKIAGTPTETGEGFERYGAVVMATHDDLPYPAIRTALLDAAGQDPYLPALRGESTEISAAEVALRTVNDERFAALLADPGDPAAGERDKDGTWWPQDPSRSVPELVAEAAARYGLGADAAAVFLMLLAMPDPTDRDTARWTGWKPARIKAARAELAATDLVIEARRTRAGRSLFLPGGWTDTRAPRPPLEEWKLPLYDLLHEQSAPLRVIVPAEPVTSLYHRAWQRVREGDEPRFAELRIRRGRRR